jgi:hypothetical protein
LRLDHLKEVMEAEGGLLPLPMLRNSKTVDPRDKASTAVYQLETAMGAGIECFDGAEALEVPRTRFAPVKSTGDLLALRSDAYEVRNDGSVALVEERAGVPPVISLGGEYKLVDSLDGLGVPSLREARSLTVEGPVHFGAGVVIKGEVVIRNEAEECKSVAAQVLEDEALAL